MSWYRPYHKNALVEIALYERFRIVRILLMILLIDPYHFFPHRQTKVSPPRGAGDRMSRRTNFILIHIPDRNLESCEAV